jgi:hypothetical protein
LWHVSRGGQLLWGMDLHGWADVRERLLRDWITGS